MKPQVGQTARITAAGGHAWNEGDEVIITDISEEFEGCMCKKAGCAFEQLIPWDQLQVIEFLIYNETDGTYAWYDTFPTREAAEAWCAEFPKRYEQQGYYLTNSRERIPPDDVVLRIQPRDADLDDDDGSDFTELM